MLALVLALAGAVAAIAAWAAPVGAQDDIPVVIEALDAEPETSDGVIGFTQPGVSQNWRVRSFAQIGDTMYVAGSFLQVRHAAGGVSDQAYLAAFDVDTGEWVSTFRPTFDDVVWDVAATADGRLVVAGEFDTVNGVARTGIVLLDTDGVVDASFVTTVANVGSAFEPMVRTVAVDGSTVYLAGDFNRIVDDEFEHGANRVGRVGLGDGRFDASWQPLVSGGGVFDLAPDTASGVVHLAGTFTSVGAAPDTMGAAAVSIVDGSVAPWSQFAFNEMGDNFQYGVGVLDGTAWVGGSQHLLQRLDADTYDRLGFYVTGAMVTTIDPVTASYTFSGAGGDFQFVAVVDGQVISGCHCHAGHHTSTTEENINVGNRPVHAYRSSGERIDWFPNLPVWNQGPYGAAGDTNGCLWIGGDLAGNVDGFARHCPFDGTTAQINRPFSPVVGDDQSVTFAARVSDPAAANTLELRVLDGDGQYLQPDGGFSTDDTPLPATTSGAGSRVVRGEYQLPVLPAGDYVLEVTGAGGSGTDITSSALTVAELEDLVIGTGQPSNSSWDVFDGGGGRNMRGHLDDPAVFGPQAFVPVNTVTLLDHATDLMADDLADVDIMWMPPTTGAQYDAAELATLDAWVAAGGVMMAYSPGTTTDTVLEHFGVPVVGDSVNGQMFAVGANSDHPVLDGVYGPIVLTGYSGRAFDPADVPADWTILFENPAGDPAMIAGPYGDGYIVALAARTVLQTQTGLPMLGNLLAHLTDVALEPVDAPQSPPVITPIASRTSPVSQPVELQVFASDPDGGTVSFSAVGLPSGLSIDSATGLISGTPDTPVDAAAVVVTVTDDEAATADAEFSWTIEAAPLDVPGNVVASLDGDDAVALSWDAVAGASGYLIVRDDLVVASVAGGLLTWIDTNVAAGQTYRYQVQAQGVGGDTSPLSEIQTITVPEDEDPPPVDPPPVDPPVDPPPVDPPVDPPSDPDGPVINGPDETGVDCSVAQPHPMVDVPVTSFGYDSVGCVFQLGITTGTSPTTYSPNDFVTRAQMAAFVERFYVMITGKSCDGSHPFVDIAVTSFAYDSVGCIFGLGITNGTSATTYSPDAVVSREQMASFIARLYRLVTEQACGSAPPFGDVPATSFAFLDVGCIASLGVTSGTGPGTYSPSDGVTRIQMAAFLERLYNTLTS